jgi:hypothetical protein
MPFRLRIAPLLAALSALVLIVAIPVNGFSEEAKKEGEAGKSTSAIGDKVDTAPFGLPVIWKGRIMNYVFVRLRLHLAKPSDVGVLRAKEPFVRDVVVRAAHRTPFTLPNDLNHIDADALTKAVLPGINAELGAGVVKSVEVLEQNAQHGLPRPQV